MGTLIQVCYSFLLNMSVVRKWHYLALSKIASILLNPNCLKHIYIYISDIIYILITLVMLGGYMC